MMVSRECLLALVLALSSLPGGSSAPGEHGLRGGGKGGEIPPARTFRPYIMPQRKCSECGSSSVWFGLSGSNRLWERFICKKCGEKVEGAVKLERRCTTCDKMGIFGARNSKYGGNLHCRTHRILGELDVKHKRCNGIDECGRWAAYGPGGGRPERCKDHKFPGDEYMRKRHVQKQNACNAHGCSKEASFGRPGGTAVACKIHKDDKDIDVRHRRCAHPAGCSTQAAFGSSSDRKRTFCSAHRRPGDVNVVIAAGSREGGAGQSEASDPGEEGGMH